MQKSPFNSAGLLDTYVKAKTTKFFNLATEITKMNQFFFKLPTQIIASLLLCVNIFGCKSVRAMEANSGRDEAIKR
jgi:hypothetical protein